MADRGIIFSAAMVRALLERRKAQTRRLLYNLVDIPGPGEATSAQSLKFDRRYLPPNDAPLGQAFDLGNWQSVEPGERLYVREAFAGPADLDGSKPKTWPAETPIRYLATPSPHSCVEWGKGRPSIHLPRKFSRMFLKVIEVRVERLRSISSNDARLEGVEHDGRHCWRNYEDGGWDPLGPRESFCTLWDSLHGSVVGERWRDNPWVVVLTFGVRAGNVDA